MKRTVTLRPGARGTKSLLDHFGKDLLFVRYRYDPRARKRWKTIELVVDEQCWLPREIRDRPVWIDLAFEELDLRRAVVRSGGRWDPERRLWRLLPLEADRLGLGERVVHTIPFGA
jgi:hypothetical protein